MIRRVRSLSLRARITLLVVGGAILPLALIAAWLSASTARSGRELLRSELDSSLSAIAKRVAERWEDRGGDLALLANNESAIRTLASSRPDASASAYLTALARDLRPTIVSFTYRDQKGMAQWSSNDLIALAARNSPDLRGAVAGLNSNDALSIRRPVLDVDGRPIGSVEARVLLSAILPTDSLQLIVAGAALRVRNRETGEEVGGPRTTAVDASLMSSRASLIDPPFDLELVASDARYVQPFVRAARLGFVSVLAVSAIALLLTTFFARRLTSALEQMADAAGAIAAGDLERVVEQRGDDEVARLATAFNTMTESLRQTLRQLARREALAAVGQFAASMSHEVRNALTGVRLDLQRLHERSPSDSPDRPLTTRALRNVQRLDSIVTGSLRIARTDPETMRPVVLESVVRASIIAAESAFRESGARVTIDSAVDGRVRVVADAGALEQLFLNLLMNAAQAMSHGGVATVSIENGGPRAVVRIADTGRGITPAALARIGEPFFSSKPNGTGLGVRIARQIAIAHGGDISVVSTSPESGTVVEVVLPLEIAPRESGAGRLPHLTSPTPIVAHESISVRHLHGDE